LRFEGEHLPALNVLDSQTRAQNECYSGNVIYLSTFSKTLAPGLRLAWVIAPPEVINKLVLAKQGADLHTSTFNQIVAFEVAHGGFLDRHVKFIREVYHKRRDVMLETLQEHMPDSVQWTHPQGGLFLWATLPKNVDTKDLLMDAIQKKVAFVPGESFFPINGRKNHMRLNFSNAVPEKINEGISILGAVIKDYLKKNK
jgi:2-aminoadipate transaminase